MKNIARFTLGLLLAASMSGFSYAEENLDLKVVVPTLRANHSVEHPDTVYYYTEGIGVVPTVQLELQGAEWGDGYYFLALCKGGMDWDGEWFEWGAGTLYDSTDIWHGEFYNGDYVKLSEGDYYVDFYLVNECVENPVAPDGSLDLAPKYFYKYDNGEKITRRIYFKVVKGPEGSWTEGEETLGISVVRPVVKPDHSTENPDAVYSYPESERGVTLDMELNLTGAEWGDGYYYLALMWTGFDWDGEWMEFPAGSVFDSVNTFRGEMNSTTGEPWPVGEGDYRVDFYLVKHIGDEQVLEPSGELALPSKYFYKDEDGNKIMTSVYFRVEKEVAPIELSMEITNLNIKPGHSMSNPDTVYSVVGIPHLDIKLNGAEWGDGYYAYIKINRDFKFCTDNGSWTYTNFWNPELISGDYQVTIRLVKRMLEEGEAPKEEDYYLNEEEDYIETMCFFSVDIPDDNDIPEFKVVVPEVEEDYVHYPSSTLNPVIKWECGNPYSTEVGGTLINVLTGEIVYTDETHENWYIDYFSSLNVAADSIKIDLGLKPGTNYYFPVRPFKVREGGIATLFRGDAPGAFFSFDMTDDATEDPSDARIEYATLTGVKAYPNPSNGKFVLDVPGDGTMEIFGINGACMMQATVKAGANPVKLDKPGMYLVRVAVNGKVAVKQLIVR